MAALLDAGVAAGVITAEQRSALLQLDDRAAREGAREVPPRALDAITVVYWIGATLVVFALGWFLADKWETLGAAGTLGVGVGYAALFAVVARTLARERFPLAGGVATALVVLTAPLIAWAILSLTGEWPSDVWSAPLVRSGPYMGTRRLVVELATVLAALLVVRTVPPTRLRRTPVAIPLATAGALALVQTADLFASAVVPLEANRYLDGWAACMAAAVLFALAYMTDVRQRAVGDASREDFAGWLYAATCLTLEVGAAMAFDSAGRGRHLLAVLALVLFAAAVRLRRRTLLAAGMVNAVWYLGWLAFEVFKDVLSFPFLLAMFGGVVLMVGVLLQRRYPGLVRRSADQAWPPPHLPGGAITAWGPTVVAAALLVAAIPAARRRAVDVDRAQRAQWARVHASRRAGLVDTVKLAPPPPRPQ
jgi:hypothetical protein